MVARITPHPHQGSHSPEDAPITLARLLGRVAARAWVSEQADLSLGDEPATEEENDDAFQS